MKSNHVMQYRPEVDGLRAVAVVPVILFHAGIQQFSGGYTGVDVFFVISGFLITSIILRRLTTDDFSLVDFYERRARRILPALMSTIVVSVVAAWYWLAPDDMEGFGVSIVAVLLFSSNILFWTQSGYFDTAAETKPLLHTWSLAVEEQYYLLFPLLLMALRRASRRNLALVLGGITFASLAGAELALTTDPAAAFFLPQYRLWELAIGSFAALYTLYGKRKAENARRPIRQVLAALGVASILWSVFAFDSDTSFPGASAIFPTAGAALVILFAQQDTFAGKVLASRPMVGIGLLSYSAYLIHHPLFAFARHLGVRRPSELALLSLLVLPAAYASWRWIEKPFRDRKRITRAQVWRLSAAGAIVLMALGAAAKLSDGLPARLPRVANFNFHNSDYRKDSLALLRQRAGKSDYALGGDPYDQKLWFSSGDPRLNLLIVGNSHSGDIFNTLSSSQIATQHFELARYGVQIGCLVDREAAFYHSQNYRAADVVVIASRYMDKCRACGSMPPEFPSDVDALPVVVGHMTQDGKVVAVLGNTMEQDLRGSSTPADRYLMGLSPAHAARAPEELAASINEGLYRDFRTAANHGVRDVPALNARVRRAAEPAGAVFLDRNDYICDERLKQCFGVSQELDKFFWDTSHNTLTGARYFGARIDSLGWLDPLLARAGFNGTAEDNGHSAHSAQPQGASDAVQNSDRSNSTRVAPNVRQ